MTREMELNRVGQQINRGEFQDLTIMNDPLLDGSQGILPNVPNNPALAREVLMRFMEVGVAFQNQLMQQLWIGNPVNASAGGGYMEFPGLDILVSTTKVDAITNTACPSLASDVKDFNYHTVDDNSTELVNVMTYLTRYLKWNADRMNMNPVTWSIVMRPELFYELTAVWPCSYMSYRCGLTLPNVLTVDSADMIGMRDSMRQGNFLTIDGMNWQVILDDAIPEDSSTNNANVPEGSFSSDIYVIPRTFLGGNVATFWEFFDYSSAVQAIGDGQLGDDFWSDGGRFLWHKKPPLNWCVQWIAKIEPRIILRTPQLAGRLNNVVYTPLQHTRQPFNDDPYFVDGGVTSGYTPDTLYHEWSHRQD
jgi:hypothetical protein